MTADAARSIAPIFTEVVVAPGYEPEALEILSAKKNLRVLEVDGRPGGSDLRRISGELLLQSADRLDAPGDSPEAWEAVAGEPADAATLADLEFAWRACRSAKSNAILLASNGAAVGIGMGQVWTRRRLVPTCRDPRRRRRRPDLWPPLTHSSRSRTACRCSPMPA